jgi:hypothetical protein
MNDADAILFARPGRRRRVASAALLAGLVLARAAGTKLR